MQDLYDLADSLGVRIEYADLSHLDRDGDYDRETRMIRLHVGMLHRLHRSVLAHEIAHAIFGDVPSLFAHYNEKQERRADEWAAHLLIDEQAYREAAEKHSGYIPAMAQELGVIDDLVEAYERTLTRIGDTVYIHARLGAGQWTRRIEATG